MLVELSEICSWLVNATVLCAKDQEKSDINQTEETDRNQGCHERADTGATSLSVAALILATDERVEGVHDVDSDERVVRDSCVS